MPALGGACLARLRELAEGGFGCVGVPRWPLGEGRWVRAALRVHRVLAVARLAEQAPPSTILWSRRVYSHSVTHGVRQHLAPARPVRLQRSTDCANSGLLGVWWFPLRVTMVTGRSTVSLPWPICLWRGTTGGPGVLADMPTAPVTSLPRRAQLEPRGVSVDFVPHIKFKSRILLSCVFGFCLAFVYSDLMVFLRSHLA